MVPFPLAVSWTFSVHLSWCWSLILKKTRGENLILLVQFLSFFLVFSRRCNLFTSKRLKEIKPVINPRPKHNRIKKGTKTAIRMVCEMLLLLLRLVTDFVVATGSVVVAGIVVGHWSSSSSEKQGYNSTIQSQSKLFSERSLFEG